MYASAPFVAPPHAPPTLPPPPPERPVRAGARLRCACACACASCASASATAWRNNSICRAWKPAVQRASAAVWLAATRRSEEHTSELQSHHDLVCRLLLEKKKKT